MAGAIYHNGQWYGLGDTVEANPAGSASDTLSKLGIDGDIYSVSSLELGETSSTAYRGDRGKTAYDHATESGRSGAKSAGLYKIGVTAQGHVASATAVAKADLTALGVADQNDVDAIEADIEGFKTVTGKYITVTDAAALLANEYELTISPVQEGSGDPSPSNVRPIHGADEVGVRVCGKNLIENTYEGGGIVTVNSDKSVTVNGTLQNTAWLPINTNVTLEPGTYILSGTPSNAPSNSYVYDNNSFGGWTSQAGQEATLTLTEKKTGSIYIRLNGGGTVYNNVTFKPMVRPASVTDSTYEPYTLHSTTITLPSTVYGGSVEQGGSGESKYRFKTFDGTEDWSWYAPSNSVLLSNGIDYRKGAGDTIRVYGLCNMVKTGLSTGMLDDYIQAATISGSTLQVVQIGQHFDIENSVEAWKAFLQENNMQLCYEVATPTSLSLTPFPQTLLEGVNNVWAEMKENSVVIDNAQQSLSYQPQNIVGQLRQEINAKPDSFAQLSDTSFSNLANGQIPKWNSTTSKWENANESGGGGTFTRISVQDIVGSAWITTPNNVAPLTITAPKEDLGLNNDDFYILEGVELVDWQDSSKKYPYVITKFVDDRENDSIAIYGFMIHNESSIRGVNHTFNFIVVS